MKFLTSIVFICITISCSTKSSTVKNAIYVDLANAVVQQIFNLQNDRNANAILPFLTVENPSHRYVAAMALASVQDSSTIVELAALLKDEYEEVRYAATYALGLIKSSEPISILTNIG